ncbi:MAG: hypothetical protein KJ063_04925 [Anaerolineae bacterium]|nr:hypothetical protein [Anaerolineae bacterium]
MSQAARTASYTIFLLKLWPEHSQENGDLVSWRFSVEDPVTGERKGFVALDQFMAYVHERITELMAKQQSDQ